MKEWNAFDTAIYNHFNSTFWKKIEAYENFDEDMKILDEKLEQIKQICLAGEKICPPNDSKCQFNPGRGIKLKAFEVCESYSEIITDLIFQLSETGKKKPLCNYMIMPELTLSKEIFQKQWPAWMKFYEK